MTSTLPEDMRERVEKLFNGFESVVIHAITTDKADYMNGVVGSYVTMAMALLQEVREQTASEIFSLAHEYARDDKTMHGSEELRSYHYFNAIAKIGDFDGR